jgi:tetratricopeptide (TPR) repeat protein
MNDLETYPLNKLESRLGFEFVHIIGDVANRQFNLRQYTEAEMSYQKVLELVSQLKHIDKKESDRLAALAYHQLGRVAQEQRQWQQAEHYYQQALQIDGEYNDRYSQASTYHQLGMVAEEQGQWQQAEQYFQSALEIFREYEDTYATSIVLRSMARLWKGGHADSLPKSVASILGISEEEAVAILQQVLE